MLLNEIQKIIKAEKERRKTIKQNPLKCVIKSMNLTKKFISVHSKCKTIGLHKNKISNYIGQQSKYAYHEWKI